MASLRAALMRPSCSFVSFLVFIIASNGVAGSSVSIVHDSINPPSSWVKQGSPSPDEAINLRIALVTPNLQALERRLYEVSDPRSADYGKYLSKEQVEAFFAPNPDSVTAVSEWLAGYEIAGNALKYSPVKDSVAITVPVSKAEQMLDTAFYKWTRGSKTIIRATNYSLPNSVNSHIDIIYPITTFAELKHDVSLPRFDDDKHLNKRDTCDELITPTCIQSLYALPATEGTQRDNLIAVSGFVGEYANYADLAKFLATYRPDLNPAPNFTVVSVDGGQNDQSQPGFEANLDTQMTVSLAPGVQTAFYSVGGDDSDFIQSLSDLINYILTTNTTTIPTVLTTSYGVDENPSEISTKDAVYTCNNYMKLGLIGVSVITASGDGGVEGGHGNPDCTSFTATFPGSCPYLTAVGGTAGMNETAWPSSSGGFSNYFSRPAYQNDSVNAYLQQIGNQYQGLFNSSGRGFPDVSAQASDLGIVWNDQLTSVDGTSASAPIFAATVAILNNDLLAAGKPRLGFLNPFLYSTGSSALNDITTGNNPGCGTPGFNATTGWDPATGLGTPNYPKLKAALGL